MKRKDVRKSFGEVRSMLLNYSVKGFKVFYDEVTFSLIANNYIKKSKDNLISKLGENKDISVVKSSFIYGPNNSGKSCFIESIRYFVNLILDEKVEVGEYTKNIFYNENEPIEFKVEYLINDKKYYYELSLNTDGIKAEILELNDKIILDRNNPSQVIKEIFELIGENKNRLSVFLLPKSFNFVGEDLKTFVKSFEFADSNSSLNVDEVLRESNIKKVSEMISKCDLQIDAILDNSEGVEQFIDEQAKDNETKEFLRSALNEYKLFSKFSFKGIEKYVPLAAINSMGTNKVAKLLYVFLNAIRENKILLIDGFDNSLHSIMSKSLISFFNTNHNTKSQLIATTHDLLLLDNDFLLRKDQIWFIHKDENNNFMYSLDDFKDNKETDSRGNIMKKYLKGLFGALPKPTLYSDNDEETEI